MSQGLAILLENRHRLLFWGALVFALVQLSVPIFVPLLDLQLRAMHVALGLSLALLAFPFSKKAEEDRLSWWDLFTIAVVFAANINIYFNATSIYMRPGEAGTFDLVLGVALLLIVLDAARRTVGWAIPIMVVLLFVYIMAGDLFPGMWKLRGITLRYVLNTSYYSPLGLFGSVTGMSATFISMFIIFGALLTASGGGRTFIDIALALTGRLRGGPAKAAVVASALFGSISGSGVANVSVTGNYTIPLMKRLGYHPNFAGAVEAIASTGGGITPPIMSVTAFMMAEFLGISYLKIIGYASIPCLMYYIGVFGGVHFRTVRAGLASLPEEEIPRWKDVLTFRRLSVLVIPTGTLLVLIGIGRPLLYAGFYACLSSVILTLLLDTPVKGIATTLHDLAYALKDGSIGLARIIPILVAVNVLVNMIGITGIAPKLSGLIMAMGSESLILALLIASIVPFLLGTSLPVVPTYVLCLSILVPPLLRLGVDPVAAHLFFIYWALLGGVTPPTCTQAIVAAGIAGGDWFRTGLNAVRLGVVAFIVPFCFVLNPAMVGRVPNLIRILYTAGSGALGAFVISYGFFGHAESRFNLPIRMLFVAGGIFLLFPSNIYAVIGLVCTGIGLLVERLIKRSAAVSVGPAAMTTHGTNHRTAQSRPSSPQEEVKR
ncbi:MAG: TRAP transporter fused permease subunit [Synergistales bacterium]|nr:TRAP transporter fused permease subunit [Synergistales bacterium]